MRIALVDCPIDVSALISEVSDESCGAATVFLGCVRNVNEGRAVTGIEYSAYRSMAEREMTAIAREAAERFGVTRLIVEHRLGTLNLGDVSVAVVAAHARRAPALDAMRFAIEQLKRRVPIWKLELYIDGTREWVANSGIGNRESGIENEVDSGNAERKSEPMPPIPDSRFPIPYGAR
jgi:molybdopterin synthase catalytic subunit